MIAGVYTLMTLSPMLYYAIGMGYRTYKKEGWSL
jgi:hypothetical protein